MENMLRKMLLCLMIFIVIILWSAECREPVLHRVGGGKYTWEPNANFTDWASHEHFYVGDWLYFGFNKTMHNVVEVNKTSYQSCNGNNFITNITKGGRDVFNLTEAKTYYFLCSRSGYCFKGMKVEIIVQFAPLDHHPTVPKIATSDSPSITSFQIILLFVLGLLWIYLDLNWFI